jgi:hypothetical protein
MVPNQDHSSVAAGECAHAIGGIGHLLSLVHYVATAGNYARGEALGQVEHAGLVIYQRTVSGGLPQIVSRATRGTSQHPGEG